MTRTIRKCRDDAGDKGVSIALLLLLLEVPKVLVTGIGGRELKFN